MEQPNNNYNDINYPIEPIWALKSTMPSLILLPFIAAFFTLISWGSVQSGTVISPRGLAYLGVFILAIPIHFFANVVTRATFHFQFDNNFLNLKQGWIRKQNRQLPFGVIQNVIVTRGPLDRLFGLSTLTVQNATQSSAVDLKSQRRGSAGFFGNTIQIPGLTKENVEIVKNALLEQIKKSPTVELGM